MAKKILMVLTSHADLGNTGEKTGFWVEEFAAPYYAFVDAGAEIISLRRYTMKKTLRKLGKSFRVIS